MAMLSRDEMYYLMIKNAKKGYRNCKKCNRFHLGIFIDRWNGVFT